MDNKTNKKIINDIAFLLDASKYLSFEFSSINEHTIIVHNSKEFKNLANKYSSSLGFLKILSRTSFAKLFGFSAIDDSNILYNTGYPWSERISPVLKRYLSNIMDSKNILLFFQQMKEDIPKLNNNINKVVPLYFGTEEWQYYFKKFIKQISSQLIKNNINNTYTIAHENTITNMYGHYYIVKFNLTKLYTYEYINGIFSFILKSIYKNVINENLETAYQIKQQTNIEFYYNIRKLNQITLEIPITYKAIALNPDARFMPKLGVKKNENK